MFEKRTFKCVEVNHWETHKKKLLIGGETHGGRACA
jgi:hypothetical protein